MISCVGGTSGAESESSCFRAFLNVFYSGLGIEEELDDVAVLDRVFLSFCSYPTQAIQLLKTAVLAQVLKRSHMSSNEALLHVRVDLS